MEKIDLICLVYLHPKRLLFCNRGSQVLIITWIRLIVIVKKLVYRLDKEKNQYKKS